MVPSILLFDPQRRCSCCFSFCWFCGLQFLLIHPHERFEYVWILGGEEPIHGWIAVYARMCSVTIQYISWQGMTWLQYITSHYMIKYHVFCKYHKHVKLPGTPGIVFPAIFLLPHKPGNEFSSQKSFQKARLASFPLFPVLSSTSIPEACVAIGLVERRMQNLLRKKRLWLSRSCDPEGSTPSVRHLLSAWNVGCPQLGDKQRQLSLRHATCNWHGMLAFPPLHISFPRQMEQSEACKIQSLKVKGARKCWVICFRKVV